MDKESVFAEPLATLLAFIDTHEFVGDTDVDAARAALDLIESEVEDLRRLLHGPDRLGQMWKRVEAAEQRATDMEKALRKIVGLPLLERQKLARAALSAREEGGK